MATDDFELGELEEADFDNGFLECLGHLTAVGEVGREAFRERLGWFKARPEMFKMVVLRRRQGDSEMAGKKSRVMAAGTLLIEPKFIHQCGSVNFAFFIFPLMYMMSADRRDMWRISLCIRMPEDMALVSGL